jgi:formate dehydrogenase major subunit
MNCTRRKFLKFAAAGGLAAVATPAFGNLGFDLSHAAAKAEKMALKTSEAKETTSVCCYCAVGCGLIVHTDKKTNRAINCEGDPDHPINQGALCAKGASSWQLTENARRPLKPLYRAPNSDKWEEKSWDWMYKEIAKRVKATRDKTFALKNEKGQTVNRCEGIASVGSAAIDNEECWVYQSFLRSLGLYYIEHQARLCHSSTVPALAESFGRGAMTNHWIDIKNSDCVLIMGSNPAENHPISFKWIMKAKEAGATIIHVDPRFTRTSSKCDIYAPLRSGTDIAFLGGMIKHIIDNNLYFKDYVVNYTNAAHIVGEKYGFQDGFFAGYDKASNKYDKSAWAFEMDENGLVKTDPTLQHPRCVFNLLKKHYDRYDLKTVSSVTGTPEDKLLQVYNAYGATGKPDKAGTELYAMGWTQHSIGVQNIRTMCMVQLLLGNIGIAGGGVNAMRGESNVQASTDQGLLFHILPGYLKAPVASWPTLEEYIKKNTPVCKDPKSVNWWSNYPKYTVSLLKAMFPNTEPAKAYEWLPKGEDGKNYSWLQLFDAMHKGAFKGFFAWGMNPACSGANAKKNREAMGKLDWMVNVNLYDNETGSFWRGPGMDPKKIKTEVFFLPCCTFIEKEGSVVNSGRWMQWRYAGPKPMGETKPDGDIIYELFLAIREQYKNDKKAAFPEPILNLGWDIATNHVYDPSKTAKIVNGYFLKDVTIKDVTYKAGSLVPSFALLQDDGSTSSGCWLYAGSYTDKGNMATRRDTKQTPEQAKIGLFPNWSWCWPVNRRILYNRASCDPTGKPWNPEKAVVAWSEAEKKWVGDVPDGPWAPTEKYPFIMKTDGRAALFGPGLNDGPFPEHYEPMECPIAEHPFSKQLNNPLALQFTSETKAVCDPRFPFVLTTYRVTEHWQTGLMTRYQDWLVEAEPQMFCEMSEELAKLRGIKNGEKVILESVRGEVWAIAIVTKRFKPFKVLGQTVHQIGIPWHFGWMTPKDGGDSANLITPSVGDANTGIPETKALMANLRKA